MPAGFLGSRANLLIDAILVINLIAPFWALYAARFARRREYTRHAWLQLGLIVLMFTCLFTLEGYIRLSGGSGSLVAASPYYGTTLLRVAFLLHILPATGTYLVWLYFIIKSYRQRQSLPGDYSKTHKVLGKLVIAGLIWIALSAIVVYYYGFAA